MRGEGGRREGKGEGRVSESCRWVLLKKRTSVCVRAVVKKQKVL